jgi:hypothetical protein
VPEFVRDDMPEHQCFRMAPRSRLGPDSVPEDGDVTALCRGKGDCASVKPRIQLVEAAVDTEDAIGLCYGPLPLVHPEDLYASFSKHQ